jgi:hypothetical protein
MNNGTTTEAFINIDLQAGTHRLAIFADGAQEGYGAIATVLWAASGGFQKSNAA